MKKLKEYSRNCYHSESGKVKVIMTWRNKLYHSKYPIDISIVDIDELKISKMVSFGKKDLNILSNTKIIKKLGKCVCFKK